MSGSSDNPKTYGDLPVNIDPVYWYGRSYDPPISLAIWNIQKQLAAQVNAVFGNLGLPIQAYVYPEFDSDTWWDGPEIAFVLIVYRGTNLSKPLSTAAMLQEATHEFSLIVLARTVSWALSGDASVYALIATIEQALTGFRPDGCRNTYFTEEKFSERDSEGGVWLFEMKLDVMTMRVKMDENYVLAHLQKIIDLVYQAAKPSEPQSIPTSNQLAVPQNTVVTAIVTSAGKAAILGLDYQYNALSGIVQIQPGSNLLKPGTMVTVFSAPVLESISAP